MNSWYTRGIEGNLTIVSNARIASNESGLLKSLGFCYRNVPFIELCGH